MTQKIDLLAAIAGIDPEAVKPSLKLKKINGQRVVGKLSEHLQKLFCHRSIIGKKAQEVAVPILKKIEARQEKVRKGKATEKENDALREEIGKARKLLEPLKASHDHINEIFWNWVRFENPDCGNHIGIYEDFTIAQEEDTEPDSILGGLFGGLGMVEIIRVGR